MGLAHKRIGTIIHRRGRDLARLTVLKVWVDPRGC